MEGYIYRLQKDIAKLEFKKSCVAEFLDNRAEELDSYQYQLMLKQGDLMDQLLDVMKSRLDYELKQNAETEDDHQPELPFDEDDGE